MLPCWAPADLSLVSRRVLIMNAHRVKKYRHGLQAANDFPSFLGGMLLCKVVPLLGSKSG